MADLKPLIGKVASGVSLSQDETRRAFNIMLAGEATPAQIGGFLLALRVRGESVDELIGAVSAMRDKMQTVEAPPGAVDIVGTGGDNVGSYNISTASAFVMAGAGVMVAKHGNKAVSSRSGAGDVLQALGLNLNADCERIAHCIREAGIGFMFAPNHHTAMRFIAPSRGELGTRTIFNMVGPMANPAHIKHQLIGVFSEDCMRPMAEALRALGAEHIWVLHGHGGLDEISITGPTKALILKDGQITSVTLDPSDVGIKTAPLDAVKGGDADFNAKALRAVLNGEESAHADMVLLNAGAGLVVAGKAANWAEGVSQARDSIASGRAMAALEKLIQVSNAS